MILKIALGVSIGIIAAVLLLRYWRKAFASLGVLAILGIALALVAGAGLGIYKWYLFSPESLSGAAIVGFWWIAIQVFIAWANKPPKENATRPEQNSL
jgi:Na+-transporting NADH:ubiquinone oxidoreductase subunit NqrE